MPSGPVALFTLSDFKIFLTSGIEKDNQIILPASRIQRVVKGDFLLRVVVYTDW